MKFNIVLVSLLACAFALSGGALQAAASDEFWQALDRGDAVAVCRLLDAEPARVNARHYAGQTPLHRAVATGNVPLVYLLLAGGADVRALDTARRTPLHVVSQQGNPYIAHLLLANLGMNSRALSALDSDSETTLYKAADCDNEAVARLLIEYGASVNGDQSEFGESPLHAASGSGHEAVVRLLLHHGANTEAINWCGNRPLSKAAIKGHAAVVRTLIAAGAVLDRQEHHSFGPLDDAARYNQPEMARLLVEHGASVHVPSELGEASCLVACRSGRGGKILFTVPHNERMRVRPARLRALRGALEHLPTDPIELIGQMALRYYQRGLLTQEWDELCVSTFYDMLLRTRAVRLGMIRDVLKCLPTDLVGLIGQMAVPDDEQRRLLMDGGEASVLEFDSPCSSSDEE